MTSLILKGHVFSGKGEGSKFISLSWAKHQIEEKLGFEVYPGTLNVRLNIESAKARARLEGKGFEILPPINYSFARIYVAQIQGICCGVVIPLIPDYPQDVLEIVSSLNLREKLCLSDGSFIMIRLTF